MNEASIFIAFSRGSRLRLPNEEIAMPKSSISRRMPSCLEVRDRAERRRSPVHHGAFGDLEAE